MFPTTQPAGRPYLVADSTTAVIRLKRPAQRIVCLSASGLDVLVELGLAPVGGIHSEVAAQPEFYGDRSQPWATVGAWLLPNFRRIRQLQPDLILGWQFPHRFYRHWLADIAPTYLMGGSGYEEAVLRLLDIAGLTQRTAAAEVAITQLEQQLARDHQRLQHEPRKTVLMMGGSRLSHWSDLYPVETQTGTLGSVLQQFTDFPWVKPVAHQGEPGLTYLSLQQIAQVDPDIIFVQSYGAALSPGFNRSRGWRSLKAVQTQQVFEVPQFWHWGNGTRLLRLMLQQLLPLIYPQAFMTSQVLPPAQSSPPPGLRQRELCDRLGLDYRQVAQTARQLGLSTNAYVQQRTGWELRDELYYPPTQTEVS
ncbi:MAG: ABC transporter substrate-binding protein [Leptolyngbyaceae cyanobacterium]